METTSTTTTQALGDIGERVTFFPNCGGQITGTIVAIDEFENYSVREDDGYTHEHGPHGLHRVREAVAA